MTCRDAAKRLPMVSLFVFGLTGCWHPPSSSWDVPRYAIQSAGVGIKPDAVDAKGNLDNAKVWFHVTPASDVPSLHINATIVAETANGPVEKATFGCHFGPAVKGEPKSYTAASCDRTPPDVVLPPGAKLTAKVVVRVEGASAMHQVPVVVDRP